MRKRILSLALAICMVAALLPAAVVTAGAAVVSYTYDFNPNETATNTSAAISTDAFTYEKTVLDAEGNEVYSPWKYLISFNLRSKFPQTFVSGDFSGLLVRTNASNLGRFVIKIKVPTAGTYNVNLQYMGHQNSDTPINIYALPAGSSTPVAATVMSESDKLNTNGALSLWSASAVRDANVDLPGTITTTSDNEERIIVFDVDSWPTAGTTDDSIASYIYLGGLTLSREVQEVTKYTVTYNAAGGDTTPAAVTTEAGAITLPAAITKDGFTFKGWSDGETTYDAGASYTVSANVTLTAVWEEIVVSVDGYTFLYDFKPADVSGTPAANLNYTNTKGLLEYVNGTVTPSFYGDFLITPKSTFAGDWIAVKINVPVAGNYDITLTHNQYVSGDCGLGDMYILPAGTALTGEEISFADSYKVNTTAIKYQDTTAAKNQKVDTEVAKNYPLAAGENIVVFYSTANGANNSRMYLTGLNLATAGVSGGNNPAYVGYVDLGKNSILVGEKTTAEAKVWDLDGNEITDFTFAADKDCVELAGTTVTGAKEGNATISATYTGDIAGGNIISDNITVEFAENLTGKTLSFGVYTENGVDEDITITAGNGNALKNADGSVYEVGNVGSVAFATLIKLKAAETSTTGAKFVYWKIGSAAVYSNELDLNYRLGTNTAITAVYDDESAETQKVEFWSANGALLETLTGDEITEAAVAAIEPTLIGYGFTGRWLVAEDKELDIDNLSSALTRAVAEHSETGVAVGDKNYGDLIPNHADGATYWTREVRGEETVVAYGENYDYYVWNETEIKSYNTPAEAKPVIVIDDYANGAYMIEYYLPENCSKWEVGILYGLSGEPTITKYNSKAVSTKALSEKHGQLAAAPSTGDSVVRGYIVYSDQNNVKRVLYTDVVTVGQ